ncbi:MAG TPA: HYR domain-containing protein [Gemmatimonadaceae bacterium]
MAAILGALAASCSDTTAPKWGMPAGVTYVRLDDDSAKQAYVAQNPIVADVVAPMSANVLATPRAAALSVTSPTTLYVKTHPAFDPEAIPNIIVPHDSLSDDGIVQHIPLGFDFEFYGNTYSEVNIYMNGFLKFGPAVQNKASSNFMRGDAIPNAADPMNIIAFAWADWNPVKVADGVRFETRGDAPNRRFLLQFNNVPESGSGRGLLMMQLVLTESTNSITIYTNTMNITNFSNRVTQGIENADGSVAAYDSVTNPINGVTSARVRGFFSLTNDAVRFSPPQPPRIFAPKDTSVLTTPPSADAANALTFSARVGTCDANVNPGMATAIGDNPIVSIVGVRSDDANAALSGRYLKGVTTITWTATDASGGQAIAHQTVTVLDKENPLLAAPQDVTANNDPHLGTAVVATGSPQAADNCDGLKVSSARSDNAAIDAPFPVGKTTVTWTATDASGNVASATQSVSVLDVEAPVIAQMPDLIVPAISQAGAIVNFSLPATDNVGVVSSGCDPASGTMFPVGSTTVNCFAADAAGHRTTASFNVRVLSAAEQLQNLINYVISLGASNGTTNPLVNQLQTAFDHIDVDNHVSCVKMNDFLSMIPKKGRQIPGSATSYMTTEATRIMTVLGCDMGPRAGLVGG